MTSSYAVFDQMGKITPDMVAWKHMARLWHFPRGFARNTLGLPFGDWLRAQA
jgi:hypothetical protein